MFSSIRALVVDEVVEAMQMQMHTIEEAILSSEAIVLVLVVHNKNIDLPVPVLGPMIPRESGAAEQETTKDDEMEVVVVIVVLADGIIMIINNDTRHRLSVPVGLA
jgi:hypothetical protein